MPTTSDLPRLYRDTRPNIGIVHLGPGAFFRAFNAVFTDEAMRATGGDWGICAVSLRSAAARDALQGQDCLFHSVTLDPDGVRPAVIGSIVDVLVAPDDPEAVLNIMTRPETKIVSMTITEKGYCFDPATGGMDNNHPDIQHDLDTPHAPKSAVGFIVQALRMRRDQGSAPFTVMACDNMPDNGAVARRVVLEFAQKNDTELAAWIAENGAFPSTMVDRITPATTLKDIEDVGRLTGKYDPAAVFHEPFRQWVIEDKFVDDARPEWHLAGAEIVDDVAAHEAMKLRCLNGAHSTLAYLGYLAGHHSVSAALQDPLFRALLDRLWRDEIIPSLSPPVGVDVQKYCNDLAVRFANPSIHHKTWQIAMDGSQKLPQRLLATVADNLEANRPIDMLALAVAGWMRYVGGVDDAGDEIDVRDPMAIDLRAAFDGEKGVTGQVAVFMKMRSIFPTTLAQNVTFIGAVETALERLTLIGVRKTLEQEFGT